MYMSMYMETGGQCLLFPCYILIQGLSLNLELAHSARWTSQQAPGVHLCYLPSTGIYRQASPLLTFYMGVGVLNLGFLVT